VTPCLPELDMTDMRRTHPVPPCKFYSWHLTAKGADGRYVHSRQLSVDIGLTSRPTVPPHERGAEQVHTVSHGLDVSGVNTGGVTAEVVGFKPSRNGSNQRLVGPAVGKDRPRAVISMAADAEIAIARDIATRRPFPTRPKIRPVSGNRPYANLCPEACGQTDIAEEGRGVTLGVHRKVAPFVAMQPEVFGLAAASIIPDRRVT